MQIILMRHGKPTVDLDTIKRKRVSPQAVGQIVTEYAATPLPQDETATEAALKIATECNVAISSDLARATDSIERLGLSSKAIVDPMFTESAMPFCNWHGPRLKFLTWCVIFRILWLCGVSANGEHIRVAKQRTHRCCQTLQELAEKNETVLVVGHGIMNRLIARELKRRGWVKDTPNSVTYWSFSVFRK